MVGLFCQTGYTIVSKRFKESWTSPAVVSQGWRASECALQGDMYPGYIHPRDESPSLVRVPQALYCSAQQRQRT
jgi:hypothetical protein